MMTSSPLLPVVFPAAPLADAVVVPVMEGVTTAIVAFIFVCVIYPNLVKNKTQFYAAFVCVLAIILLHSLNTMIGSTGFQVFAGAMTGLLQVAALVLLFTSAGGLTVKELAGELGRAYEVIRRGEEEKTVIIPLSGEMPKPRQRPGGAGSAGGGTVDDEIDAAMGGISPGGTGGDAPPGQTIDLPPQAGWPTRRPPAPPPPPPGDTSLPLE